MPMPELPDEVRPYKEAGPFTETTLPDGLRRHHTTAPGVWARIVVDDGALDFEIEGERHRLQPGRDGVVPPQVPHAVSPVDVVRFRVVFHRRP